MDEPALVRRLTTIISVDVVGFSTMSARNEEHALDLLGARMATTETIVKHHRGRVFKLTGDGMLAEFVSPVEAVRAALEIQESMRSANATADQDNQLVLRIGVNLGDVVESGDDLMGDAVNVAVRLEFNRAAGRHLRVGLDLRADRRQAHPRCRGHGRAARQEHPPSHPCLPAHAGRQDADRHRAGSAAAAPGAVTSPRHCRRAA